MKLISFLTLSVFLTLTACSHHKKECHGKAKMSCTKENCKKACCDKKAKCADGSCSKEEKKNCTGESCHKKS